jgi:Putative restriction endonuclease
MSQPVPRRGDSTAEIVERLPEDDNLYEVIDGQLHVVYGNEQSHTFAVWSMALTIVRFAWKVDLDVVLGPRPYRFTDRRLVHPDILVPGVSQLDSIAPESPLAPELIVEVSTPYSRRLDWTIKRELYASERVREYWVVDIAGEEVSVYRHDSHLPKIYTASLTRSPTVGGDKLTIDLAAYFAARSFRLYAW